MTFLNLGVFESFQVDIKRVYFMSYILCLTLGKYIPLTFIFLLGNNNTPF